MSGSGKRGKAVVAQTGSKKMPFNDPEILRAIESYELCSDFHGGCDYCPDKRRCRGRYDIAISRYTDHENRYWKEVEFLRLEMERNLKG